MDFSGLFRRGISIIGGQCPSPAAKLIHSRRKHL